MWQWFQNFKNFDITCQFFISISKLPKRHLSPMTTGLLLFDQVENLGTALPISGCTMTDSFEFKQ